MITGIEVSNFKGFRELKLSGLGRYHVLVGPNGSGKSTFFEILEFVRDLLLVDVQEAVNRRHVSSLRDLTYDRKGGAVFLDVMLEDEARYILMLSTSLEKGLRIESETLIARGDPAEIVLRRNDCEPAEYKREDQSSFDCFSFPFERSALSQVPPDERRYRTANLVKRLLVSGIRSLKLDSPEMGAPCPPDLTAAELLPDGRNLARVAGRVLRGNAEEWLYHLRLALEDLDSISWRQREDDRAEYLVFRYKDGLEIPSWLASFGTLRTLALTLPAFLPEEGPKLYLFEEPENGIHPKAIEIVMDAIHSIPNAQTFVTTHSPMVVQLCEVDSLLLFTKKECEVRVQHGPDNAILREWDGVPDLATVVGSRVLG